MNRPYKRMMFIFIPATIIVTLIAVFGQPTYNAGTLRWIWLITIGLTIFCLFGEYVMPGWELEKQDKLWMTFLEMIWDALAFLVVFCAGLIGLTVMYLSILSFS